LTARDRALELEQELSHYPDERGEILLETGSQWKLAGEPDRAVALWGEVVDAASSPPATSTRRAEIRTTKRSAWRTASGHTRRAGTCRGLRGRNEPCWCGSARKYKKCCGDPRTRSDPTT
jgi:hypothetical protein